MKYLFEEGRELNELAFYDDIRVKAEDLLDTYGELFVDRDPKAIADESDWDPDYYHMEKKGSTYTVTLGDGISKNFNNFHEAFAWLFQRGSDIIGVSKE